MTGPEISVVVPVYNAMAVVPGCLASLDAQTLAPERYEVVVVDDGSTDATAGVVEAFLADARARFTFVRRPENRGPAAARNAGLAVARAPLVAFTDSDCEVAPDWLERALARFAAEPEVAGVEGRTDPKGDVGTLTHQMRNEAGGLFMTCNMVYRREAIDAAGGFDERFRLAFLEDSDLAFAIMDAGGAIAWDPDVIVNHLVIHEGRGRFLKEAKKRYYNPLLFKKHPALYRAHLRPVVPGIPGIHVKYMASVLAPVVLAPWLPGLSVLLAPVFAWHLRRVAFAYKARDPVSILQAAIHPFVQTYWVLAGAIKFRSFSLDL